MEGGPGRADHDEDKDEDLDRPGADSPDAALEFRRLQQQDENGHIPPDGLMRAKQHVDLMRASGPVTNAAGITPSSWTWLGPGNIGGRVRSIVVHPALPSTWFAGSVSGGIWKTTDSGGHWQPVNDFLANLSVSTMVMQPGNPLVMYAGTGESYQAIHGAGVFKSTDGGATWGQLTATASSTYTYVNRLAMSPNGAALLVATSQGIYLSLDAGDSFTQSAPTTIGSRTVNDVVFHPTDNSKAIASGDGTAWYSIDGGVNWVPATGLPGAGRVEIAYAQSNPAIVYASVEQSGGTIYKSTNGGVSYSSVSSGTNYLGGQGWYDNALWVDPTNSNTIIVGGPGLFKSVDGGVTLSDINGSVHADKHTIVSMPGYNGTTNRQVLIGCDGGVYFISNVTAAPTGWEAKNNNLGITQFYGAAGHAGTGTIVGGTQDNGTLRYTPAGGAQAHSTMFGGDGGYCAADPSDPNYFYGEYVALQIHRSSDGGASSRYIYGNIPDAGSNAQFIAPFVLDPNNPNTMLAGGASLWRSTDVKFGNPPSFASIKSPAPYISAIAIAQGNSNICWVGYQNGDVSRTSDCMAVSPTWTQVDNNGATLPNRMAMRLTIDPSDPSGNRVYATFGGFAADNVWRTTNGGASWTSIGGSGTTALPAVPVHDLEIFPGNPNWLYAATEVGVFTSQDAGATWRVPADGPANVMVSELFWMGSELVAATFGRGIYKTAIQGPPALSISDAVVTEGNSGQTNASVTVSLSTAASTPVSVDFATADGTALSAATTYAGSGAISIPIVGNGTPYPSTISVPNLPGTVTKVSVSLKGYTHEFSRDVDVLLVGPTGQSVVLMSDVGGPFSASGVDFVFDDAGPPLTSARALSGTYKPTNIADGDGGDIYSAPAPPAPYGTTLAAFAGVNPAGPWRLFVVDDANHDQGSIASWSVILTVSPSPGDYIPVSGRLTFSPGEVSKTVQIPVLGDVTPESAETFTVNLSNATAASIADGVGVVTILDDDAITQVPAVTTLAATTVTATGATLNATVNPNGSSTTAVFDYGPTPAYGLQAAASTPPGSGTSPVPVSAAITGLICNTSYHARASATNPGGSAVGVDVQFVTAACGPSTEVLDGFIAGANDAVFGLVVQPDGKILVGGRFTTLGTGGTGTATRNRIGRLNPDGTLDASFNPGANGQVSAMAVQPDGKILVGGLFTTLGGGGTGTASRNYLGRLNADGSLDASFNPGANAHVLEVTLQPDGKILVGGDFTTLGGGGTGTTPRNHIGRLNADGSLDASFNPGADAQVIEIVPQPDGKILVSGDFTTLGGGGTGTTPRNYLGRLNADGSLDTGFNPGADDAVRAVAVQPDGKILVGGIFSMLGGGIGTTPRSNIGRINPNGSVDTTFNPGANSQVRLLAVQPDGRIVVGGRFTTLGGGGTGTTVRNRLGRLNADGSLDPGFNPGANDFLFALTLQPDGKILVGGAFTTLGGGGTGTTTRNRLGRLNAGGSIDADLDPGANGDVYTLALQPDGKMLVGGLFSTLGGGGTGVTARFRLGRLNVDGSVDAFDPGANFDVRAIALQPDGKVVVAGFFTRLGGGGLGTTGRNFIGRLNADGSLDSGFNPSADGAVVALAVQPDGKILIGGFFTALGVGGSSVTSRSYVARLNSDGSVDGAFDPGANAGVLSLALQPDGRILVGGNFTTLGGGGVGTATRNYIGRLNADGSLDAGFDPGASAYVNSLSVQADGRILVGGGFHSLAARAPGAPPRFYIGRINGDGSLDEGFDPGANSSVNSFGVQADGKILVGGYFTLLGGGATGSTPRSRIGRLNPDGSVDSSFDPGADNTVWALAIQADGKMVAGGAFTRLGGGGTGTRTRNRIGRLANTGAATQNLSVSGGSVITWLRGATGPEVFGVTFESSTNGAAYAPLGSGVRVGAGWQLSQSPAGEAIGPDLYVRARGYYGTGLSNASGSIVESVRKATVSVPGIAWTAPAPVVYGTPLGATQLNATSSVQGTFIYKPDYGTALPAGSGHTLSVTFTPADTTNYTSATATVTIAVLKATPTLTWPAPAAVVAGTPLGAAQLNAIASVPGTFVYSPDFGALLGVGGGQTLSVTFTPSDATNYTTATKSVSIDVLEPAPDALDGFIAGANDAVFALAVQPDGKILVGGRFTTLGTGGLGTATRNRIGRLNPDGSLDAGFNPGTNGQIDVVVLQPDGKILVGGGFTALGGGGAGTTTRNYLGRLNPDGSLDTGFNPGANGPVSEMAVQPDGKILVAGAFTMLGGGGTGATGRSYIARVNGDGSLDAGFDPGADGDVRALALQSDGKVIVGGTFSKLGGGGSGTTTRNRIGRLNADGSLDANFNPGADSVVSALAVQPDGKILVGGQFATLGGGGTGTAARKRIGRLNRDGSLDVNFSPQAEFFVTALAPQPDGKILVGGKFATLDGTTIRRNVGRLNPDGSLDLGFNSGASADVWAVALEPNGKILVGGFFTTLGVGGTGATRNYLGRLYADGSVDADLNPGANDTVYAVAVQPDGKILASGLFSMLGGGTGTTQRFRIGRFNVDGSLDVGFDPGANYPVTTVVVQPDGKIVLGGFFTRLGGGGFGNNSRNHLGRLNADGSLDSAIDRGIGGDEGSVGALALQPDGKILVGGFFYALAAGTSIARLNADGSPDLGFKPSARGGGVAALAVQPDGRIVVGGTFYQLEGGGPGDIAIRRNIGRLNPDGTVDHSFDPGANQAVHVLVVQPDGKILVAGSFTTLGGGAYGTTSRNRIGRLNTDGSLDASFDPGANGTIETLALQADGKILVGGQFTMLGGGGTGSTPRNRIARLHADGSLDVSFDPGADNEVMALALQPDGKIVAGGSFTTLGGGGTGTRARNRIGRLANTDAATENLSVTGGSVVTWSRSGAGPEVSRVTFESSTDGASYTPLGTGTRVGAGWQLNSRSSTGDAEPSGDQGPYVRARGYYSTGVSNVSSSIVESVRKAAVSVPAITWATPVPVVYGTPLGATQLNATANVAGTFVYEPDTGAVLTAGSGHTLSVTFAPGDPAAYTSAITSVTIDVLKATPTLTWGPPADVVYGSPLSATQLNATAGIPGTFAYSPALGTRLNAGAGQTLRVTFTPSDTSNYTPATASVSINVVPATPAITWPAPLDIATGTPLGAAQLNASANLPGVFTYTPAAGTVLAIGTHTLSVSFAPADSNYSPATASVMLTVTVATAVITYPANGAINADLSLPIRWTPVAGAQTYWLYLGTTVGFNDLLNSGEMQQTFRLVSLPAGQTVYARLWTRVAGIWRHTDSSFSTAGVSPLAAVVTYPADGASNADLTMPMQWTTVSGVQAYWLYVGSAMGFSDFVNTGETLENSRLVTLPAGQTVYARLWTKVGGVWRYTDSSFSTAAVPLAATLTYPPNGATNADLTLPMQWAAVTGAQAYWLYVGSTPGTNNLVDSGEISGTSRLVSVPGGQTLYARLWTRVAGTWRYTDSSFSTAAVAATLTYPLNGAIDVGPTLTMQWTAVSGAQAYRIYVGSIPGANDLVDTGEIPGTSRLVSLPAGQTVYVRLWTKVGGALGYTDSSFSTAVVPTAARR